MALSEKQKELIEQHDRLARENGEEDTPLDEESIQDVTFEDVRWFIGEFWEDEKTLETFSEYPWLYRLLRDVIKPLKETFLKKNLEVDEITLLSMDTIRFTLSI